VSVCIISLALKERQVSVTAWGCDMVQPLWKTAWQALHKVQMERIITQPSNSTPRWITKKMESLCKHGILFVNWQNIITLKSQKLERAQMFTHWQENGQKSWHGLLSDVVGGA
jgi:hypothetical protein